MMPPRPILNLDFMAGGRFDRRLAFTRASSGVRTTPQGRLRTAPPHLPRLDAGPDGRARGLLFEPPGTNLLACAGELGWADAPPTTASVQAGVPGPDGTPTAARVGLPGAVSVQRLRLDGLPEQGAYTASLHVRPVDATGLDLILFAYERGRYPLDERAVIDFPSDTLQPGSTPGTSLVPAADGWLRVTMRAERIIDGTAVFLLRAPQPLAAGSGFAVDVWGAQLEPGTTARSFVATGADATGRAEERCTLPLACLRGWPAVEGTLFVEAAVRSLDQPAQTLATLTGGAAGDGLAIATLRGGAVRAGADGGPLLLDPVTAGARWRTALAWSAEGCAACLDGGAVSASGAGPPGGLTTLHIGGRDGADPLDGWIGRVALYRGRLDDALLRRITRP